MTISSFDDLLRAAREQNEPQRLLFVFATAGVPDDAMIQSDIDRKMAEDEKLSALGVSFTVLNGKVTLLGTVASNDLKRMAESAVKKVKGVRSVDNKIIVTQ